MGAVQAAAKRRAWRFAVPLAIPIIGGFTLLILPIALMAGVIGLEASAAAAASMSCSVGGTAASVAGVEMDAVQMGRAQTIANVAAAKGLDSYAATIALATAQQVVTRWAIAGKGRALWLVGDRAFKVQTVLTPLEEKLTYTNDAIKAG